MRPAVTSEGRISGERRSRRTARGISAAIAPPALAPSAPPSRLQPRRIRSSHLALVPNPTNVIHGSRSVLPHALLRGRSISRPALEISPPVPALPFSLSPPGVPRPLHDLRIPPPPAAPPSFLPLGLLAEGSHAAPSVAASSSLASRFPLSARPAVRILQPTPPRCRALVLDTPHGRFTSPCQGCTRVEAAAVSFIRRSTPGVGPRWRLRRGLFRSVLAFGNSSCRPRSQACTEGVERRGLKWRDSRRADPLFC